MKTITLTDGRVVDLYCFTCEGRGEVMKDYIIDNEYNTSLLPNRYDDKCSCGDFMTLEVPLSKIPFPSTFNSIEPQTF